MTAPTRKPVSSPIDRRRRRHQRYRVDFRLKTTYLEAHQYKQVEGHCSDLSEAGIGLLLPTDMNMGEVVGLNFSLPGSEVTWEVRAVARHRRGYHYGFEFLSLNGDQRENLRQYLKNLEPLD
jgi:c-di-GMP-binding flagellar brake protein YcgR